MVTPPVPLRDGEKLEPLDAEHYIIQSDSGYRFGSAAVALAKFAARFATEKSKVVDLCSGCGVIGILLAIEKGCAVDGAELDKELFDMSVRSAKINGLDRVSFYNADIRALGGTLPVAAYDLVVCNPPFYKTNSKPCKIAPSANSELTVKLEDIIVCAERLLKVGGTLCMVHTASRLDEVLTVCREHGLTPKDLEIDKNCKTFMLKAIRGGKNGLNIRLV